LRNELSPNALYQNRINVSFVSGKLGNFAERIGYASSASYNGITGIALDKTEQYAYIASGDSRTIRKLNLATTEVGSNIASKYSIDV
jgi:hypothetical protein